VHIDISDISEMASIKDNILMSHYVIGVVDYVIWENECLQASKWHRFLEQNQ